MAFTFSDEAIGKEDQDEDLAEHEAEGFSIEWPAAHLVKNEDMENGYADGEDEAMVDGSGEDSEMEREVLKATLNVGNRVR